MRHPDDEIPNGKIHIYTVVVETDYDPTCIRHEDEDAIHDFFNNQFCERLKCEAEVRDVDRVTLSRISFGLLAYRKLKRLLSDAGEYL